MSSEEEFTVLTEPTPESHSDFLINQPRFLQNPFELSSRFEEQQLMMKCGASGTRRHSLEEDRADKELQMEKEKLDLLRRDDEELLRKIQSIKSALMEEDSLQKRLEEQIHVLSHLPERGVYLGELASMSAETPAFDMKSRILYPMEGGTALITFEDEAVAKQILTKKQHFVAVGTEYRIRVEAQPVQLVVPKQVEMDSVICSRRVLVSNLPQMDPESLLDKLGFHFSQKRNGGGEVETCLMMEDTWTAVIAFTEDNIAGALALKQFHDVQVQRSTHRVRLTPFIISQMSGLEAQTQVCSRTVLLTGIPDIQEPEVLQDFLEIHFQKGSNGGGEVLQCQYNPLGHHRLAVFSGQRKG